VTEPRPVATDHAAEVEPAIEQPPATPARPRRGQSKDVERAGIDSLRELANLSAKSAVAKHSWRKLRSGVAVKLGLIVVSIALAGFLFATRLHSPLLAAGAGMAALLLAGELIFSFTQFRRVASYKKPSPEKGQSADGRTGRPGANDNDADECH
jgi:hypothetical protein